MSGDGYSDDSLWNDYTTPMAITTTTGVAPSTASIEDPPPALAAPQVMVPYGFIALTLAAVLLFVGLRNVRAGAPKQPEPLAQKLARAPDNYQNDESSEDEFLNGPAR